MLAHELRRIMDEQMGLMILGMGIEKRSNTIRKGKTMITVNKTVTIDGEDYSNLLIICELARRYVSLKRTIVTGRAVDEYGPQKISEVKVMMDALGLK